MSRRKSLQQPKKRTEKHLKVKDYGIHCTPYKGVNEERQREDNTKRTLQTNQRTDIDVMKITLISYDTANVWRSVKEIQLTTF